MVDIACEDLRLFSIGELGIGINIATGIVKIVPSVRVNTSDCTDHLGCKQNVPGRNHIQQQVNALLVINAGIKKHIVQQQFFQWRPLFTGYKSARAWLKNHKLDVAIIVYNDHASAFSFKLIPTFALGVAEKFPPADEGCGRRQVPVVEGHSELA